VENKRQGRARQGLNVTLPVRALLVARKQLLGKLLDIEFSIRGILRGFGLKVDIVTRKSLEQQAGTQRRPGDARDCRRSDACGAHYSADGIHQTAQLMSAIVRDDDVCRRPMTAPGVGPSWRSRCRGRPEAHLEVESGGRLIRTNAEQIPIGRDRRDGRHQPRWRRDDSYGPLRGGEHPTFAGDARSYGTDFRWTKAERASLVLARS
jgi:hypothetical protein